MASEQPDVEAAQALAQTLLESGLGFERKERRGGSYLRRMANSRGRGPTVTSFEEVEALGLKPRSDLQEALRGMLLTKHEQFQKNRRRELAERAAFFKGKAWLSLRYQVLAERGARCECCGASSKDGAKMQVDHIKPRSKYPELALDKSNLQMLCRTCNMGKSNRSEEDWRADKPKRILRKS